MGLSNKLTLAMLGVLALSAPRLASAANCTVSNGGDSGGGSLRDCIDNVATNAGDIVTIDPNITVNLTSGQIIILQDITVQGAGDGTSVVDGGDNDRIFEVGDSSVPVSVHIAGVTLQNGLNSQGGAIYLNAFTALRIANSLLQNNDADSGSGYGGAIYSYQASLIIEGSQLNQNTAYYYGGAIYQDYGTLTLIDTSFNDNSAEGSDSGYGGALYAYYSTVEITDSTFTQNSSDYAAGAIYNDESSLTLTGTTIGGANSSDGNTTVYYGGGLYNYYGNVVAVTSTISNNTVTESGYYGGAIYTEYGALNLINSTLSSNNADNGGGIYSYYSALNILASTLSDNKATDVADNGGGYGGALYTESYYGGTIIANSTFSGNTANEDGGAIYNYNSTLDIVNSTFSGNSANGNGGALYNDSGYGVNINNVTIANNVADADGSNGGDGGGIYNDNSSYVLSMSNTILANNSVNGPGENPDCFSDFTGSSANLTSRGHNLIGVISTNCEILGDTTGNLTGDPGFDGGLADNSGPTQTIALAEGSQAINAGDNVLCEPTDQRGITRPQEENCDIGAFEFVPAAPPPPPPPPPVPPNPLSGGGCSLGMAASGMGSMGSFALLGLAMIGMIVSRRKA